MSVDEKQFAILLDGALRVTERVMTQIRGRRVLAADGGIRHAEALGVAPELWLGDFDSTDAPLAQRYPDAPREPYPTDKPRSDGEIAIRHALDQGATDLLLVGALGGDRSDHVFFNLSVAATIARNEAVRVVMTSGAEEAIPLLPRKKIRPGWHEGTIFSVLCFTQVGGLTIENAKWPLDRVNVPFGSTLTLSNIAGSDLGILLASGCGIAIAQVE